MHLHSASVGNLLHLKLRTCHEVVIGTHVSSHTHTHTHTSVYKKGNLFAFNCSAIPVIFYTAPDKREAFFSLRDELLYIQLIKAYAVTNRPVRTLSKYPAIFKIVAAKILLQLWKQLIITRRKFHDSA